jgi:SAM-dependent methyltransferase
MDVVHGFDGKTYQERFDRLAKSGVDVHGEAALVRRFVPLSVLDAGCGTGRVAIELARTGIEVVGVDQDPSMIAEARRRHPALPWLEADICDLRLDRTFDVVVMAGNVPIFCPAPRRPELIAACARHVAAAGRLVAGFQLGSGYSLADYDAGCRAAGLELEARWSTWDGAPFEGSEDYAVSVHIRPTGPVATGPDSCAHPTPGCPHRPKAVSVRAN